MKSRKETRKVAITSSASTSYNQGPRPARPSLEEIRLRAYEIYVERGQTDGQDVGDWLQAEKELTESIRKGPRV
jgi:Protein of unknown function (DUF2934)